MPTEQDYSIVFNRLAHMVVLSQSNKTREVVDDLVLTVFVIDATFAPLHANNIREAIRTQYGLSLSPSLIQASVDRHITAGRLLKPSKSAVFALSPSVRLEIGDRIEGARQLEVSVKNEWLTTVATWATEQDDGWQDELWNCLRTYMAKAFRRHGAETIRLLDPSFPLTEENKKQLSVYLEEALCEECTTVSRGTAERAIREFFHTNTPARIRYVAQHLDATFTFFALTVDRATSAFLSKSLSTLFLFLDTNFIFGILDLTSNPLKDVSQELIDVINERKLPFKLYYHEATLAELQRTISGIGNRLRSHRWPQWASRAAIREGYFSGLELRYHERNAITPVSADVFLSKYEDLPTLLSGYGFRSYSTLAATPELDHERYLLIADYDDYIRRHKRSGPKPYEAIDHDMTVLQTVTKLRKPTSSALNAGAFFLSTDYYLYSFDWQQLRKGSTLGMVVLPNQFLQLLRPFVPATDDFNRRFVETFAIPEFRVLGTDYSDVCSKVLSYLAEYKSMNEEQAARLLANKVLAEALSQVDEESEEFAALIESAIADDNIQLQRDNALLRAQLEAAQTELDAQKEESVKLKGELDQQQLVIAESKKNAYDEMQAVLERVSNLESQTEQQDRDTKQQISKLSVAADRSIQQNRLLAVTLVAIVLAANTLGFFLIPRIDRIWLALIVGVEGVAAITLLPIVLSWTWLAGHPNRHGLYYSSLLIVAGLVWAVLDTANQSLAIGSIVIGSLLVIGQILGTIRRPA
ncbi:MAG: hypothetical protein M3441_09195 [Chloroflexota bacterium]|nr:hypothetical protein [Chloroflexota bacterium]